MELTNTGENAMKNQENRIVGMKLTGIRKTTGEREEIAGTTGFEIMDNKRVADIYDWLISIVVDGEFDDYFENYEIEAVKTFTETSLVNQSVIEAKRQEKAA